MIKAAIFDFGGVLTTSPMSGVNLYEDELGLERGSLVSIIVGEEGGDGNGVWHKLERGEVPIDDLATQIITEARDRLGVEILLPDFMRAFVRGFGVREQVVEFVRDIRGHVTTALLTNNVKEFGGFWRAMIPVEELFEVIVDSSEIGLRKPDPRIYHATLEAVGVTASEAVFVDDLAENVRAAEELGIAAVHFTDEDVALARLRELVAIAS